MPSSPGQNVIIQANYVNYSTLYEKLSENYAESKKHGARRYSQPLLTYEDLMTNKRY